MYFTFYSVEFSRYEFTQSSVLMAYKAEEIVIGYNVDDIQLVRRLTGMQLCVVVCVDVSVCL